MKIAIMQPYFLPYIGYFQLMAAVDRFVLLDDVNFINRGWINRNRIAVNGESHWLTIPLLGASQNKLINDIEILPDVFWKKKMLRTVQMNYASSPHFEAVFQLLCKILYAADGNLSSFLSLSLIMIKKYLGLTTDIELASGIYPKLDLKGEQRILDICTKEAASTYVNPYSGKFLYKNTNFAASGVDLLFLDSKISKLRLKHSGKEGPMLSILDLMMLNPPSAIARALTDFELTRS